MHLAYVLDGWPRFTETFVLREIIEATTQRREVSILALECSVPVPVQPEAEALAGRVAYVPDAHGFARASLHPVRLARALRAAWRARREGTLRRFRRLVAAAERLRRDRAERVHAHFARWATAAAEVVAAYLGVPWGFTAHAYDVYDPVRLGDKARRADWAIVCSAAARAEIAARYGADVAALFHLVRHGVDLAVYRPLGQPRAAGPMRILAVGGLVPKKGFDVLLGALEALGGRHVAWEARLVGDGPLAASLGEDVARRGVGDRLRLDGPLPLAGVRDLMQRWADVLVVPSRVGPDGNREGLPNVVGEAMACGVPVVGTRVGAIPEMVEDGVTGRLVPPDDAMLLAEALEDFARAPEALAAMGRAARSKAEEVFDAVKNLAAFFEIVDLGRGRGDAPVP